MPSVARVAAVMCCAAALQVHAQPRANDPADPAAASPPLAYASAFADYKPLGEPAPGPWRAVNDRVREAAEAAAKAFGATSPAPATTPLPRGHAHHGAKP